MKRAHCSDADLTGDLRRIEHMEPEDVLGNNGPVHPTADLLDGLTSEVFSQPDILQKAFLEPPQITQLAQSAKELGFNPGTLTVEEMLEQFEVLRVRQP